MSRFCGKCDFYDGFVAIRCDGDEEKVTKELKNLKLYVHGRDGRNHRVKSDTIKDIAKYYPYLEAVMHGNKEGMTVILSSDSFIDEEERELLQYRVDYALKYWRKCKRNKVPFSEEECLRQYWGTNDEAEKEIVRRIAKDGDKVTLDGIHSPLSEHFRREWFEELVKVGYTELEAYNWCFKGIFDDEQTVIKRLGRPLNYEK